MEVPSNVASIPPLSWQPEDVAYLAPGKLPRTCRAWERRPRTPSWQQSRLRMVWRRYNLKTSRPAAFAQPVTVETSLGSPERIVKRQCLSANLINQNARKPAKRVAAATRWDRRLSKTMRPSRLPSKTQLLLINSIGKQPKRFPSKTSPGLASNSRPRWDDPSIRDDFQALGKETSDLSSPTAECTSNATPENPISIGFEPTTVATDIDEFQCIENYVIAESQERRASMSNECRSPQGSRSAPCSSAHGTEQRAGSSFSDLLAHKFPFTHNESEPTDVQALSVKSEEVPILISTIAQGGATDSNPTSSETQQDAEHGFPMGVTISGKQANLQQTSPFSLPNPETAAQSSARNLTNYHLVSDTALLQDFLARAAASKASRSIPTIDSSLETETREHEKLSEVSALPSKPLSEKDPNAQPPLRLSDALANPEVQKLVKKDPTTSVVQYLETSVNEEDTEDDELVFVARRSTRHRISSSTTASSASFGPNKITLKRTDGTEAAVLRKTDAQNLVIKTRANTRRNKFGALPVSTRLKRLQKTMEPEPESNLAKTLQDGQKGVRWAVRIAVWQGMVSDEEKGEDISETSDQPDETPADGLPVDPTAKLVVSKVLETPDPMTVSKGTPIEKDETLEPAFESNRREQDTKRTNNRPRRIATPRKPTIGIARATSNNLEPPSVFHSAQQLKSPSTFPASHIPKRKRAAASTVA